MSEEGLSTRSLIKRLLLLVVGMFAFGFLLVPIYDVMCQAFGINGKTAGSAWQGQEQVDMQREVRVQFVSSNAEGMRWSFGPQNDEVVLHPGEARTVNFLAHNPTDKVMVAQAIPSVAPSRAAAFLHKTECFCFTQQVLQPGESIEMPVRFVVDPALPKDVRRLTLAYTLFDVTERMAASLDLAAIH
ncbi:MULTISPECIES: cytochrome c oxidase assembly protein [Pseudomonadaceae]|uniref:Cytochrome c oxidase assembly protein CtaG n=1 Tax=Halopseudomonas litoralis TaxID=797277 RepID=A0A1H1XG10_9GAMM|nr:MULTISPECIES: cytochrome c oxidase assembly protein [Pseudomonadaceae]SDT07699.1 cytochrome c oxidase assembly protein subunit 11 [Halopseudomonas litoralis]